jgi:7-cyano-7-deazaguanine synthase
MIEKPKIVALLSGGLDSCVLAASLLRKYDVHLLALDYGQRHNRELRAANAIATALKLPLDVIDLGDIHVAFAGAESSQVGQQVDVPEGHYADDSMRSTVVPNRNMILLALAAARAISIGAKAVAYAAHAGDHAIYPDCRPQFATQMARSLALCHFFPISLETPFLKMSKADIVRLGDELGAPLGLTYSCYVGDVYHCGACGTCVERKEAFQIAGVPDPTLYKGESIV